MSLIIDGKVSGRIDAVNSRLILEPGAASGGASTTTRRYTALVRWAEQMERLGSTIEEKHTTGAGGGASVTTLPMGGRGGWQAAMAGA